MSENSKIEWTDTTWNPIRGCSKVSPGCKNCYAESIAERFSGRGLPFETFASKRTGWTGKVALIPEKLTEPLRWKKPRRIFVNSMSDLFHEDLPFETIAAVFGVIAACADRDMGHQFQVLTKRPQTAVEFFEWLMGSGRSEPGYHRLRAQNLLHESVKFHLGYDHPKRPAVNLLRGWPLPNVHIGVSVENQKTANERIPLLLQIPAAVHWLSCEPLLEALDFTDGPLDPMSTMGDWSMLDQIDWVVVGGESGPNARPCNVEWIRSIVRQCRDADVPVFVKQDSGPKPGKQGRIPDDIWVKEFPR